MNNIQMEKNHNNKQALYFKIILISVQKIEGNEYSRNNDTH